MSSTAHNRQETNRCLALNRTRRNRWAIRRRAKQPIRADQGSQTQRPSVPMMDPFTEQPTHSAGDGQGANASKPAVREKSDDDRGDEETMPIDEGFFAGALNFRFTIVPTNRPIALPGGRGRAG